MNKKEFLAILYDILCDEIGSNAAKKHVEYYDQYISNESKNNKTEKEVIDELGNPRLIAKSIIEAGDSINTNTDSNTYAYSNADENMDGTFYNNGEYNRDIKKNNFTNKLKFYGIIVAFFIILALVLGTVFGIVITIVKLIIKFIVPIAIIYGLISIYNIMKK